MLLIQEEQQILDIRKAVDRYSTLTLEQKRQYKVPVSLLAYSGLIPKTYLHRYARQRSSFKRTEGDVKWAVEVAVTRCLEIGVIKEVDPVLVESKLNLQSAVYIKGEIS